jgi:histidinol-phosphatase (PHP family)
MGGSDRNHSLAEFAPAGAKKTESLFGRNSFLPENPAIAASVEAFARGAQRRCDPDRPGARRSGSGSKISNFHTHTIYCDGKDTPRELAEEALRLGCPALGFSGHSYTAYDPDCCMSPEGTAAYRREVLALREEYAGKLDIRLGLEQDYYSELPREEYDYLIGSVHAVKKNGEYVIVDWSRDMLLKGVEKLYGGDIYAFAEDYFRLVGDLWERTRCRIVGHFDLLTKFNEDGTLLDETHPRYLRAAGEALDRLLEAPVLFEINTGAMARGYRTMPYPGSVLRRAIARKGGTFILSSDCHRKEQLLYGLADQLNQPYERVEEAP